MAPVAPAPEDEDEGNYMEEDVDEEEEEEEGGNGNGKKGAWRRAQKRRRQQRLRITNAGVDFLLKDVHVQVGGVVILYVCTSFRARDMPPSATTFPIFLLLSVMANSPQTPTTTTRCGASSSTASRTRARPATRS